MKDGGFQTPATRWIVDSGASQHMTQYKAFFNMYKPISGCKEFKGDNSTVETIRKGSILVETRMNGHVRSIRMHDMLHVPNLHLNLLIVNKLILRGLKVHFD